MHYTNDPSADTHLVEHYKFQNPLSPETCWSQYFFYVWKGFA